jgi:predicted acylesterase/phospholipase RssA
MNKGLPDKKEKRIGYALGGGAARGLFHIGVLSVFEEYGIYPDVITGTSMGSIIGALYASGYSAAELKQMAIDLDWKQIIRLTDITLPLNGLVQGRRITALLKSIIKDRDISQLKIKYACVATDLTTGEQIVFDKGPLIDAIRASISIPLIFTPVKVAGRILVDGGLVNVVPVSVCRDLGADFTIGVNCITGPGEKVSLQEACKQFYGIKQRRAEIRQVDSVVPMESKVSKSRIQDINDAVKTFLLYSLPKGRRQKVMDSSILERGILPQLSPQVRLIDVISQTFTIVMYQIAMDNIKDADLAISPFAGNIGFWQFNRAKDAITAGEIAARLALQRDDIARIMLQQRSLSHS